MSSTDGMVDYDDNSSVQLGIVRRQAERIAGLVRQAGRRDPAFHVVDYGCGPGLTTVETAGVSVRTYRARFPGAPVVVSHADQPGNDWTGLARIVEASRGYGTGETDIRTETAVGSFYEEMLPRASVDVATCFAASHWLRQAPTAHAPESVFFADLVGPARAQVSAAARADWQRFLRCRAAELRPGGGLLTVPLGSVPDEAEANGAAASGRGIYRALTRLAREMADEGLIDPGVLDRFVFGVWFLTEAEAREAIESDPVLGPAFEIHEITTERPPTNADDVFADAISDPAEYARLYVGYIRGFADSTLRTHLFGPSTTSSAEADRLAEEFYRRLDRLYRDSGSQYACEIWSLVVVLRRTDAPV